MKLVERLQYHIDKISESQAQYDYQYSGLRKGMVEVCINPNSKEFQDFLKSQLRPYDGLRGLCYQGEWYFWNQIALLHDDIRQAYDFRYKSFADFVSSSVEITHHNSIHRDHWDKLFDLQEEMDKPEFLRVLSAHIRTLKDLKKRYNTDIGEIKEVAQNFLHQYKIPEYDPMFGMNKQQRHDYRKAKYDKTQKEIDSIIKDLKF